MWMPGHGWVCLLPGPTNPQTHLAPRCPTGHRLDGEAPLMPDGTCRACWNEQALRSTAA